MDQPYVLVVEDYPLSRKLYVLYLHLANHRVVAVASAEEALRQIAICCPRVVVLDMTLPDTDGPTLARRLKQDAQTARVPLLLVTAHRLRWREQDALAAGADGFLLVPEGLPRLAREVKRLLERPQATGCLLL